MKKLIGLIIPWLIFAVSGCPSFEPATAVTSIKIFTGGAEKYSAEIEEGETVTFTADTGVDSKSVSIVWELDSENAAITSSGEGANCGVRGMFAGTATLTVKAWRNFSDAPALASVSITVIEPQVKDIVFNGPSVIGVGEERLLSAELVPAWAGTIPLQWSTASANVQLTINGAIQGISAGIAEITATAGSLSRNFDIEVKGSEAISGLSIYNGTSDITSTSIEIGLYEEINLSAKISPPNAYTWFNWSSSNPENVSVNQLTGELKGLIANSSAQITVSASGQESSITVTVKNPVTGIRVKYNNAESLPVINTIWLSPGEELTLKAELAPDGITGSINWSGANSELSLSASADGEYCTLTGRNITRFDALPTELHITAENAGNSGKPVSVVLRVKTQAPPIWAWDRARDMNTIAGNNLPTGNATLQLQGRGDYADPIRLRVFGNSIPYTESGMKINSSNQNNGNPDPAAAPGNSTRIMIGSNSGITSNPNPIPPVEGSGHQPGDFNFLGIGGSIRVSVDYEIIWSAGAGRNMWITLNNNQANATQSVMGTNSQILIQPLTDPRGTRLTAVTTISVDDFTARRVPAFETLETAFIGIVCLSNGGSIYVSGIRIERED